MFETGRLRWRVLPDLGRLPGFEGRFVEDIVWVVGLLRKDTSASRVFEDLVSRYGVHPFLVMRGDRAPHRLLLEFYAIGGNQGPTRIEPGRRSAQAHLESLLSQLTITRERIEGRTVVVNHRYHSLLARGGT